MDEGDPMALECPLCCSKKFTSKTDLICHLGNYANSIKCSLCKKQYPTLLELIEHLRIDNCGLPHTSSLQTSFIQNSIKNLSPDDNDQGIAGNLDNDPLMTPKIENALENFKNTNATVTPSEIILSDLHADDPSEHIYEFFNKALAVGDYSEEKMKLVPGGNNDYVIVAQDSQDQLTLSAEGIVTKQNSDGTISINAIDKDGPKESDTVITMNEKDIDADLTDEIYNCNSCGMSFTSVLDHVQTYHKNQDVVVEVNEQGDDDNIKDDFSIEYDPGTQVDKNSQSPETNAMDFVTINEATKSIITQDGNIEETVDPIIHQSKGKSSKALFHQVVMKEMVTIDSGQKISVFYCNACHTYVTDLSEFKSHPCKMLSFTCTQCPASFETSKALQTHVKTHKAKKVDLTEKNLKSPMVYSNGGPFKCEICKTVFLTNKSLKLHKRMHDPLKLRPIEPPVDSHDGNAISSDEKYFCSICEKLIPLGYKSVHMEYHENLEVFNCDICNKKFTSNEYLTMHMNVHNLDKITETQKSDKDRPYSCLYCERKFARPHEKVKHERIHTGEKPHSCEICGKSFRVAYCLTLHMRTHTGARPYACLHCGKRFKAHSVYNHHLLTHSDVRAYKCPYCPKAFKTSVQLCGHKKSHTKPFSCKDCNRPFASLYAARRHAETHKRINNLKYSCTLCGASYARTFALKDHMKQAHKDEDAYVVDVNGEEKSVWGYFAQDQDKADDALDDVVTMGDDELPAVITSVGS